MTRIQFAANFDSQPSAPAVHPVCNTHMLCQLPALAGYERQESEEADT